MKRALLVDVHSQHDGSALYSGKSQARTTGKNTVASTEAFKLMQRYLH
jgi:hypothetical protein